MKTHSIENPVAKTGMLIRRPAAEVFAAFIDPTITTKFWFTNSTGKLETGKQLEWRWEMYNITIPIIVKKIEPHKIILIEWGDPPNKSTVEWSFKSLAEKDTYVSIVNSGFQGDPAELLMRVADSTKGFTFVLAGLKALLEHNIQLNLVADAFPAGIC